MQPPSVNSTVSALRFFLTVTIGRPDLARRLTVLRRPRRLPRVLSVEEVALLLQAPPGLKYCRHRVRRRAARLRGDRAQGRGCRLRARAPAGRARQEPAFAKAAGRRACRNRAVEGSSGEELSAAILDPPPTKPASASLTQAAGPSNPHRRQTARPTPRVPSLEAFGRRPAAPEDRSRRAGNRNR